MRHAFLYQLKLNFLRLIGRNKRFALISILVPIFFYLLFTKVVSVGYTGDQLQVWHTNYLVSMVVYSLLINAIMAVSSTLVGDRENGFEQFITVSPLPKSRYYLSIIILFLFLFEWSIGSLLLTGFIANQVTFQWWEFLSFFVLLPISSFPLILIGILLSLTGSPNVVSGFSNLLVFPMAIVSGLWWPIDILPNWLQTIGKRMPTFFMSDLLQQIIQKQKFVYQDLLGLFFWFVVLIALLGGILRLRKLKGYQNL